jgi:hypothetical protein
VNSISYRPTKKETKYIKRKKKIRQREHEVEGIVLSCLEAGAKQAIDILRTVQLSHPEVPERWVMRMVYRIMGVDMQHLPDDPDDDLILL